MTDRFKNLIWWRQKVFASGDKQRFNTPRNQVISEIKKAKLSHNVNKVKYWYLQKAESGKWHKEIWSFANMIKSDDHPSMCQALFLPYWSWSCFQCHQQTAVWLSSNTTTSYCAELCAYLPSKGPQFHQWEIYGNLKKVSISKACCPDNFPQKV